MNVRGKAGEETGTGETGNCKEGRAFRVGQDLDACSQGLHLILAAGDRLVNFQPLSSDYVGFSNAQFCERNPLIAADSSS